MNPKDEQHQSQPEQKGPPPFIPPSGPVFPSAYKLAIETTERAMKKSAPTLENLEERRKEYENNYIIKEAEMTPASKTEAFSQYGKEPFYHIVIRHKNARDGFLYDWYISPSSGVIITRDINKDTTVEKLSLSDIIYYLITKEVDIVEKKLGVTESIVAGPLTKIIQYNVASGETDKVLRYIGLNDLPKTFRADDTNEIKARHFQALLGTVNLRNAIFLIKDYGKQLGIRGIESVTMLKVNYEGKSLSTGLMTTFQHN